MYKQLFVEPLRRLYLSGPWVLGFWEGKDFSAVCQELTGHSEAFWHHNPEECWAMIDKRFDSYLTALETLVYFYLLLVLGREAYYGSSRFLHWWASKYLYQDKDDSVRDSITYIYHGLPNHCIPAPTTIQVSSFSKRPLC